MCLIVLGQTVKGQGHNAWIPENVLGHNYFPFTPKHHKTLNKIWHKLVAVGVFVPLGQPHSSYLSFGRVFAGDSKLLCYKQFIVCVFVVFLLSYCTIVCYVQAKVVDEEGKIVPVNTPGELCTRGYTTMLNYWGRSGQNAGLHLCGQVVSLWVCVFMVIDVGKIVNTPGELCTRGYTTMLNYWDDPDKTQDCISVDRWYHSRVCVFMVIDLCKVVLVNISEELCSQGT